MTSRSGGSPRCVPPVTTTGSTLTEDASTVRVDLPVLIRRASAPALVVTLVPALVVLPTVTPPHGAPHPVTPRIEQLRPHGVDRAALAQARGAGPARAGQAVGHDEPELITGELRTRPYLLAGVTWARGTTSAVSVSVRTRTRGRWSGWQRLDRSEPPDPATPEGRSSRLRAGTEPLLTPAGSDGVQVRVDTSDSRLPADLRVDLIDPGRSAADAHIGAEPTASAAAEASQPTIHARAAWGADESLRDPSSLTVMSTVKAFVVHHTASSNAYDSASTAAQIRAIYAYATRSEGYSDFPYNFVVDKYGRIFEGRAGGVDRPVRSGATGGFNDYTSSVTALGNFDEARPASGVVTSLARLASWKLGLHRVNPAGSTTLVANGASGTTSRYRDGTQVTLPTIFGHRQVGYTACPGRYLGPYLASIRSSAFGYAGASLFAPSLSPSSVPYGSGIPVAVRAGTPRPQSWRLDVALACTGTLVRTLSGSTSGNAVSATWDLRRSDGRPASPGAYVLRLSSWSGSSAARVAELPLRVTAVPGGPVDPCAPVPHALVGDWDGDGADDLGWYHLGVVVLRMPNGSTVTYRYGDAGDVPVVGDWDGDGVDTLGVVRLGVWYLRNRHTSGYADTSLRYGNAGDLPVAGDWDGDGRDGIGVVRANTWYLRSTVSTGVATTAFVYGNRRDQPLVGDWDRDGRETPAVYRAGTFYLRDSNSTGVADRTVALTAARGVGIAGAVDGGAGRRARHGRRRDVAVAPPRRHRGHGGVRAATGLGGSGRPAHS